MFLSPRVFPIAFSSLQALHVLGECLGLEVGCCDLGWERNLMRQVAKRMRQKNNFWFFLLSSANGLEVGISSGGFWKSQFMPTFL